MTATDEKKSDGIWRRYNTPLDLMKLGDVMTLVLAMRILIRAHSPAKVARIKREIAEQIDCAADLMGLSVIDAETLRRAAHGTLSQITDEAA